MNQRHIVLIALLPPHQQAAVAIEPAMCPVDNPSLGFMLTPTPLLDHTALRNMHRVAALLKALSHIIEVVTFVATHVLRVLIRRRRSLNCDGIYHRQGHPLVMAICSSHTQTQRCAAPVCDNVPLGSRFGAICWVFACGCATQWSFRDRRIERLPEPENAALGVIFSQE